MDETAYLGELPRRDVLHLARDLLRNEPTLQPRELTLRVLAELPVHRYEAALGEVLPQWLRQAVYGNHGSRARDPGGETQSASQPTGGSPSGSSFSSRWANVSAALRRSFLGVDGWKPLDDFTAVDAEFAASERRRIAKDIEAAANQFDVVLKLLHEHEAERVRDLPPEARALIEAVFG